MNWLVTALLTVPTGLFAGGVMLMGASISTSVSGTGGEWQYERFGIFDGTVMARYVLGCVVLSVLIAAWVGLRAALRAPAARDLRTRYWHPAVAAALLWGLLAWLSSGSVQLRAETDSTSFLRDSEPIAQVTSSAGVSVLGAAFLAAAWTLLGVWVGRMLVRPLGRQFPAALEWVGGRHLHHSWQVLVTDAMLRRGMRPPPRLSGVARDLRTGRIRAPGDPLT